jgi:hypothetical protein
VLLAGLGACVAANGVGEHSSSQEFPAPPPDVMAIHTYWLSEAPPCPVVGVKEISARSENGLRWEAWNLRAQAVVRVRSRIVDSMPGRPAPLLRVFEGVAVRFAEGCTPPADSASARSARS